MARCVSWRYHVIPGHKEHVPGDCRECWTPCREKVGSRGERCRDCLLAIISSPDQRVREALLMDSTVADETLQMLTSDPHPLIAMRAQEMLTERRGVQHQPPEESAEPGAGIEPAEPNDEDIDLDQLSARTPHPRPRSKSGTMHPSELLDGE